MNILVKIDQLSFKKLLGMFVFTGLLVLVPTTVWLTQQETRLASEARIEKPISLETQKPSYGPLPSGDPQINLVWPFLGKVGDGVFIRGRNFGNNPRDKELKFAGISIGEEEIINWQDGQIEFLIPGGARSGNIEILIGTKAVAWNFPVTVYDLSTTTQITREGNKLKVIRGPSQGKLIVWMEDFQKLELAVIKTNKIEIPDDGRDVLSLLLYDEKDDPVDFFVEPDDFGF